METIKIEQEKNIPESVEEAVKNFIDTHEPESAILYLKNHHDDIAEFCLQVHEIYKEGDNTGIYLLAKMIKMVLAN